ncbi:MAG TPA: response regulator [Blastocatellia bacterium]|nr:response regulator [Blastocatellia bacterium]
MISPRILVVEDESIVAEDIRERLQRFGYEVADAVSSGEAAIARAAGLRPDLVLMDISLSGAIDGIEAAEKIHEQWDIPVVFLTAYSDSGTLQRARSSGSFGYLLKPFDERELRATVEIALYRHRLEKELKESRNRLAITLQSIGDGVISTDSHGIITYLNPVAEELTGWTKEEATGRELSEVFNILDETTEAVAPNPMTRAIRDGVIVGLQNHTVLVSRSGRRVFIEDSAAPIRDEKGRITGGILVFHSVNERRHLEDQLRQAQKMEAIGRLAGGIAHDFNNITTVVYGQSELLLKRLSESDPARNNVEEIKKAGERAASLTRQLLAFSRKQILQPRVLDLNEIILEMEDMLRRLIGEDIELTLSLAPALGKVKADPGQLQQVLLNLVINARDAMPQGGRLIIETADVELSEGLASEPDTVAPGRYVMVAVSDTGTGMTPEVQERIFEPFFTTKEQSKGTGLGLSTVYGIVSQSGGCIRVHSEPGAGTSFSIYLPQAEEDIPEAGEAEPLITAPAGGETILLVEDEAMLRRLFHEILEMDGFNVLEAANGREALQMSERYQGRLHLLITDVIMPQMSGYELADQLLQRHPGLKIIFMSGYTDDVQVQRSINNQGVMFIQKPFTPEALERKIREALEPQSPQSAG